MKGKGSPMKAKTATKKPRQAPRAPAPLEAEFIVSEVVPAPVTPPASGLNLGLFLDPKRAISHFLEIGIGKTGATCGSFILINPNTGLLDIEATRGMPLRIRRTKLHLGEGVTGWVATTGKAMRIPDVRKERKYVTVLPKVRSELAVPVEHQGQVLGVINLDSVHLAHFSEEHERAMTGLAAEAAEWLRYGWELTALRAKDQQLNALVQMGRSIVSMTGLDETLSGIVANGARLMKTRVCSLMLLGPDKKELVLRAACGAGLRYQNRPPLRVDESLVGAVVKRKKPCIVFNVETDPRYHEVAMAREEGLVSMLAVPLIFAAEAIGVLNVYTDELHRFSNQEIKLLQTLADLSAVAIERTRLLTRVVDTEESLRQSERLSALGLLAAEVAHEIRNPLTVMQMLFHSLVSSTPMNAAASEDARIIEEKMRHMNRIVDQILSLVRSAEPIKEPVDLGHMIDDIVLLVRHKLHRQGIEIRRDSEAPLPPARVDRAQIEQAILNLVLNAVGAMPEGGALTIGTSMEEAEGESYFSITVRDNGVGMSAEQIDNLFAPFLTTKQHGTGIGLAIVARIMENHSGRIEVESKPKRGTRFRLLLPAG